MTKPFRWDQEKNEQLILERGVSFEVITVAIETGIFLKLCRTAIRLNIQDKKS